MPGSMANARQLEAEFLARLARAPAPEDLKAARVLLEAPPYKSEAAVPLLRLALAVIACAGDPSDLDWLEGLSKEIARWPKTWARDWYLRQIASTLALMRRLAGGPAKSAPRSAGSRPHARWLALAAKQSPADLAQLLRDFVDGPATQIAERAEALLGWPKDPRIATAAFAAHRGKLVSDLLHPLWPALGNLIAVHANATLRREGTGEAALAGPLRIAELRAGPDAPPAADGAPPASAAPITALEWEAWVLGALEDLQRRALWADWLLERNDPRGELLTLQLLDRPLSLAEERRVTALVKKHGRSWLGKVGQIVEQRALRFERGVAVAVSFNAVPDGRVVPEDPHWATLREIEIPEQALPQKLERKLFELLPGLTAFFGLHFKLAQRVFAAGSPSLQRISFALEWGGAPLDAKVLPVFQDASFPALKVARLHAWPQQARPLREAAWFAGLDRLVLSRGDLPDWLWLLDHPRLERIDRFTGHSREWEPWGGGFSYLLTRERKAWSMRVVVSPGDTGAAAVRRGYSDELIPMLKAIPAGVFGRITLEAPKNLQPPPAVRKQLGKWIDAA